MASIAQLLNKYNSEKLEKAELSTKFAVGKIYKAKNYILGKSFTICKHGPEGYHYIVIVNSNSYDYTSYEKIRIEVIPSTSNKKGKCKYEVSTILYPTTVPFTYFICSFKRTLNASQTEDCNRIKWDRKKLKEEEISGIKKMSLKCNKLKEKKIV